MKVALISDSLQTPSGFGTQSKILAHGLIAKGHDVHVLGAIRPPDADDVVGLTEWFVSEMDAPGIDSIITRVQPDVCIAFSHMHALGGLMQSRAIPQNCPMYLWLPWEGVSLPIGVEEMFAEFPSENIVHVSEYSRKLWADAGIGGYGTIYHSIDPAIYNPVSEGQQIALREKWSHKLNADVSSKTVIVAVDRNHQRKRWDKVFDYVRRLHDAGWPVQLIANTPKVGGPPFGHDLEKTAAIFGVAQHVVFTDFDWQKYIPNEDIAELYQMSDFRVSMSEGEGLGIPSLEAMACGCPNIAPNHTAFPEVLGQASKSLVPIAGHTLRFDAMFGDASVVGAVERTVELLRDKKAYEQLRQDGVAQADKFQPQKMIDEWDSVINRESYVPRYTKYRYGWFHQRTEHNARVLIANVCKRVDPHASVKVFGTFLGEPVDVLTYSGLRVTGYETCGHTATFATPHSNKWTHVVGSYTDPTPLSAVTILWDSLPQVPEEDWDKLVDALARSPWMIIKHGYMPTFSDTPVDTQKFNAMLGERGMHRRVDIENIVSSGASIPMLPFQIWHSQSPDQVPAGFR